MSGDDFIIQIDADLRAFSSIYSSNHRSISRVPYRLHKEMDKICYEPEVISIGPYHVCDSKDDLKAMEGNKIQYLKLLLQRREEDSVSKYVKQLKKMEHSARKFYSEPIEYMDEQAFVKMMLLDGCFIIEHLRRCTNPELQEQDKQFRLSQTTLDSLARDLLLLENQLPFFVLNKLFDMTLMENEQPNQFVHVAINFLSGNVSQGFNAVPSHKIIKHLPDLLHQCWRPSLLLDSRHDVETKHVKLELIPCVSELEQAGIRFKEAVKDSQMSLFEMKFKDGVLSMPKLTFDIRGEKIFCNLLAYEQCSYDALKPVLYVTDYVRIMATLISTGKDVKLLRRCGVIDCGHGNDEVVATLFSRLADSVLFSSKTFIYSDVFIKVESHYNSKKGYWIRKWTSWKVSFWHDYFNTPWGAISVIAAAVLLVLTFLQTIYTMLSYFHPHK